MSLLDAVLIFVCGFGTMWCFLEAGHYGIKDESKSKKWAALGMLCFILSSLVWWNMGYDRGFARAEQQEQQQEERAG